MYICAINNQQKRMKSNIEIQRVEKSKIDAVDFDNLPFGSVFSDHMLNVYFKDGEWQNPIIRPYAHCNRSLCKIFHYGQSIFEGMKAYKDANGEVFLDH